MRKVVLRLDTAQLCALICLAGANKALRTLSHVSRRDIARALPELERAIGVAARVRRIRKPRRRARRRRRGR